MAATGEVVHIDHTNCHCQVLYDPEGRLVRDADWLYTYDAEGRRRRRVLLRR